jgi:hypothetical protein
MRGATPQRLAEVRIVLELRLRFLIDLVWQEV